MEGLAEYIREKVLPNKKEFALKGDKGREAYEKHFVKDLCIYNLKEILNN